MRVLMLGWEFPPFISGGLGTACHGLTKALDRRGTDVTFVLPQAVDTSEAAHVTLISPDAGTEGEEGEPLQWVQVTRPGGDQSRRVTPRSVSSVESWERTRFVSVPSEVVHPYEQTAEGAPVGQWMTETMRRRTEQETTLSPQEAGIDAAWHAVGPGDSPEPASSPPKDEDYGDDLLGKVSRYARFCVDATADLEFDVIHAHDWLTYPAGLWIARATGKPLVVHVHSTEFDRSGVHINQLLYDIERRGMHGALKVITVSQLTKNTVVSRYGVPPDRVEVVYNGVEMEPKQVGMTGIRSRDKIVLYFGRITFQKGPEYFIAAARRVLDYMGDVKFVVAGSGDMARRMIEMAAELGIGHKVLFTGFLRGADISRVFQLADVYVMPSVSEPFGIAPLEAMSHDVPVLISKTSGVSEVLSHALKVDFWNIDDMADKIIAILRHPPLSQTLREHGSFEVRKLTWDGAAQRCEQVYDDVVYGMTHPTRSAAPV